MFVDRPIGEPTGAPVQAIVLPTLEDIAESKPASQMSAIATAADIKEESAATTTAGALVASQLIALS